MWAGQALPLFDVDFRKREWVPYSGWPFSRLELAPYYSRAEEVMEIPRATYDAATWPQQGSPPAYTPSIATSHYSQFAKKPNFIVKYGKELERATNVNVVTHANVASIEVNDSATLADEVVVRPLQAEEIHIRSRFVVVCCGGVESARLLLLSDSVEPGGVGNSHGVVGRFFQDHPGMGIPVTPINKHRFSKAYDSFRIGSIRYAIKIAASTDFQIMNKTLHTGAEVYYPLSEGDPISAAKEILKSAKTPALWHQIPRHVAEVARQPAQVVRAAARHYVLNRPASVGSTQPHLGVGGEQEPNPLSRVSLSHQRDEFGQRRAVLDWRLSGAETRSMEMFVHALAQEWERLDLARIDLANVEFQGRERGAHGGFVDANHHMGTTRMGTDPKVSVVDPQCRVHGYHNLYIGSSAVFPTGGASNPTLTIIALCLRIADDIRSKLN